MYSRANRQLLKVQAEPVAAEETQAGRSPGRIYEDNDIGMTKTIKNIRYGIVTVIAVFLSTIGDGGRLLNGTMVDSRGINYFEDKELLCVIDLGSDMRGSHGLETGFSYEVLNAFAEDNGCKLKIITKVNKEESYIDSLKNGRIDLLVTHHEDTLENDGIRISQRINDCTIWAMDENDSDGIRHINLWMHYFTASEEYNRLQNRFFRSFNPIRRAEQGMLTTTVSPYDELLKKYAAELGWDWRMLAAVVYQESKFSINAKSHRGAVGLMQVMPNTGRHYGIEDLSDPENNLIAGTRHLKRIQDIFVGKGLSDTELVKFTLAAYNAGVGRIRDCQSLAAKNKVDNSKWDNIVKIIPMMREDSILEDESVRLGKFQGHETISYVESVMALYNAICTICPRV